MVSHVLPFTMMNYGGILQRMFQKTDICLLVVVNKRRPPGPGHWRGCYNNHLYVMKSVNSFHEFCVAIKVLKIS